MTDNLDEEALDNPINPQSKSFSDEIISANETDTGISNQETENMEVHKHPHHVTHTPWSKTMPYIKHGIQHFLSIVTRFF